MTSGALVLVANARLPSQRAQSLQVVQSACAFARAGVATTLYHARRVPTPALPAGEDLFAHYGVPPGPRARVEALDCVDWIDRVPVRLQFAPARVQELSFARCAARRVLAAHVGERVLVRELETALHLVRRRRPRVFLELHRVPGGRLRRRWLLEAARRVSGVVAISGGVREDLRELGVDPEGVVVAHDALEPARFAAAPARAEARERLGLPAQGVLAVYAGGLWPWKGVDLVVDAARSLPGVRFAVVGGADADVAALRARAAGLENLRVTGFRPPGEVPLWLAAADLGLVPNRSSPAISARHTSPLKVFEAMAVGLPLVASDLPSLRELLRHDEDAWLVPPDDAAALAAGVARLAGDRALRERLGARFAERAAEHTWDERARRLLAWMDRRA